MENAEVKKGATVDVRVENLAFGGMGIARREGMVIFIEKALPGDLVRALVTKRKPQYAEAKLLEILEPSPKRQEPRCPVFGICGGCKWQNFPYEEQLHYKQQHVEEALRHIARQQHFTVHPIIASPDPWNYRNKMEYSFGTAPDGKIQIGLHCAGDFRKIIDIESCSIHPAPLDEVLGFLRRELNGRVAKEGAYFKPYNKMDHSGFLRHLIFRYSQTSGEFLVAVLTADGPWKGVERFVADFMREFPQCKGFLWGLNNGVSDVARMDKLAYQAGEGWITERLGEKSFRVSTFSFFQTNTRGAKLLYDAVRGFAELDGNQTVLDAYCGTGTIGIYVSDLAKQVVGIELVPEAVWDARFNAKLNGAENCTFLAGEMREVLATLPQTLGVRHFDRVIVDPPRGGMDKKSLRQLIELNAPLLVYVSCNPTTLARDVVTLSEAGYKVEEVQPVDMFPQTYHVESVLKFRKVQDNG